MELPCPSTKVMFSTLLTKTCESDELPKISLEKEVIRVVLGWSLKPEGTKRLAKISPPGDKESSTNSSLEVKFVKLISNTGASGELEGRAWALFEEASIKTELCVPETVGGVLKLSEEEGEGTIDSEEVSEGSLLALEEGEGTGLEEGASVSLEEVDHN